MVSDITIVPVTKVPATSDHGARLEYNTVWMDKVVSLLKPGRYLLQFIDTKKRTHSQLAYYRGVILPAFSSLDDGSYTADEWHIILGNMFLQREVEYKDKIYYGIRSTSDDGGMTTKEFAEYLDKVILYALSEHGLQIPEPRQVGI
jgi:hypothetical protein